MPTRITEGAACAAACANETAPATSRNLRRSIRSPHRNEISQHGATISYPASHFLKWRWTLAIPVAPGFGHALHRLNACATRNNARADLWHRPLACKPLSKWRELTYTAPGEF